MNHVRSSNSSWLKEKQQTFGENKIYIENEFDMIIKEGRKVQTYCWWWCLSSFFSLSRGWGWWAAEGLLFIIRHSLSLISDWSTATILASDWSALTQSSPCWRHDCLVEWTRATWGRGVVTDILTIFWHFSLISPVSCLLVCTRHLARSLYRAPSLTSNKLSTQIPNDPFFQQKYRVSTSTV